MRLDAGETGLRLGWGTPAGDRSFLCGRVASAATVSFAGHEPLEASTIVGYHWFTHEEIVARENDETFLLPGLGALLGDVLSRAAADPVSLTVIDGVSAGRGQAGLPGQTAS